MKLWRGSRPEPPLRLMASVMAMAGGVWMRVEVRALIIESGRVAVLDWVRNGERRLSLPGGRIERWESAGDALVREVQEELQVEVEPGPFVTAFEVVGRYGLQDVNLVFEARLTDPAEAARLLFVDPLEPLGTVYPPILDSLIPTITGSGVQQPWLGNVWRQEL